VPKCRQYSCYGKQNSSVGIVLGCRLSKNRGVQSASYSKCTKKFSPEENGWDVKVTTKLRLFERLGKKCDETALRHTALLGLQVECHLTFTAPAISTHARSSFKTPYIDSDPYDSQHKLTLLCCNYFEQFTFLLQYTG
jgi:hypothetical protein